MMVVLKNFSIYGCEQIAGKSILFLKDSNGLDWYESQKLFMDETLKIIFNSDGVIVSMSYDVSSLWPINNSVAEIDPSDAPEGLDIDGGWMFNGAEIVPRTYTAEEWQEKAEDQRKKLLSDAASAIADWRTELQLNVISDDDKASLIEWMSYIKSLKTLDLSSVRDEETYNAMIWPASL